MQQYAGLLAGCTLLRIMQLLTHCLFAHAVMYDACRWLTIQMPSAICLQSSDFLSFQL